MYSAPPQDPQARRRPPSPRNAQLTETGLLTISLRSAASAESRLTGRRGPGGPAAVPALAAPAALRGPSGTRAARLSSSWMRLRWLYTRSSSLHEPPLALRRPLRPRGNGGRPVRAQPAPPGASAEGSPFMAGPAEKDAASFPPTLRPGRRPQAPHPAAPPAEPSRRPQGVLCSYPIPPTPPPAHPSVWAGPLLKGQRLMRPRCPRSQRAENRQLATNRRGAGKRGEGRGQKRSVRFFRGSPPPHTTL